MKVLNEKPVFVINYTRISSSKFVDPRVNNQEVYTAEVPAPSVKVAVIRLQKQQANTGLGRKIKVLNTKKVWR